jgi:hypothetical protein
MAERTNAEKEFGDPMLWNLGDNGGEVVFRTFEDARRWALAETQSWRDTLTALSQRTGRSPVFNILDEKLNKIFSPMLDSKQSKDGLVKLGYRGQVDVAMKLFVDGRVLTKEHPRWKAMMGLLPDSPFIVLGEVAAMLGANPHLCLGHIRQDFQALFLAGFNNQNSPEAGHMDEAKKLEESVDWAVNKLTTTQEDIKSLGKSAVDLRSHINEIIIRQEASFADQEEQLELIRTSYVGERQLEEPSHHWNKQAELYKGRLQAAFWYLIFVGFGVGLFLSYGADDLLKTLMDATNKKFQYSHVAILIILAGGIFWLMNIVSKQINHTRARMADAEFRKTASDTFIALLKDKQRPIADDDKRIILDALFRPSADDHGGAGMGGATPATFLAQILQELRGK